MPNVLKHKFVSAVADDPDATIVRPSNWNDEHSFSGGSIDQLLAYNGSLTDHAYWYSLPFVDVTQAQFGAIGNGIANDTAAFQAALDAGVGLVVVPPGIYRITSTLTITTGCRLVGYGCNGGGLTSLGSTPAPTAILNHDFNGNLIEIIGVDNFVSQGVGSGLENIMLRNVYGDGTADCGDAIKVYYTDNTFKPNWLHFHRVFIEIGVNTDHWTYCLNIDADATSGGISEASRNTTLTDSRFTTGLQSTASVSLKSVANFRAHNVQFDALDGNSGIVSITGTAAQSANNYFSNCNGSAVELDNCAFTFFSDCSFGDFTTTANTDGVSYIGGRLTNAPTTLGIGVTVLTNVGGFNEFSLYSNGTGLALRNPAGQNKLVLDSETATSCFIEFDEDENSVWTINREGTTHDLVVRNTDTGEVLRYDDTTATTLFSRAYVDKVFSPTYGTTVSIDASLGNTAMIVITDGVGFTIANPTNLGAGQVLRIQLVNQSGGAHGAITWGGNYKLVGAAGPTVANGMNQTVIFENTAALREISRTAGDVAN